MTDRMRDALPDLLRPGVQLVFIGTAAGQRSHQEGAYYAKNGNCFWSALCDIGLTDWQLRHRRRQITERRAPQQSGVGARQLRGL
jgi:G:T/U-mismatch repair DNA glycosylase